MLVGAVRIQAAALQTEERLSISEEEKNKRAMMAL